MEYNLIAKALYFMQKINLWIVVLMFGLSGLSGQDAASASSRKAFAPFEFNDLGGKTIRLEDYEGKVVLIDFWATWCSPCVRDMPNVVAVYEKYHDQGFEVIGVSLDKKRSALARFIETNKMPWPQYFDGKGWGNRLAEKYKVSAIPTTYLLDKKGRIYAYDVYGEALVESIEKALAE